LREFRCQIKAKEEQELVEVAHNPMAGDIHFDGGDDLEKELKSVEKRGGPRTATHR
jgi:hypothetical protein